MSNDIIPDLRHELDITVPFERERFRVETDEQAIWAMRKLAALRAQKAEYIRLADAEMDRITQWIESVTKPLENDAAFFENLLADYGRRQRIENDRKSIALPHGKINTRSAQPKWHFDPQRTLDWLTERGLTHLIQTEAKPRLADMKQEFIVNEGRVYTADGEWIDTITVEQTDFTVSVTTE